MYVKTSKDSHKIFLEILEEMFPVCWYFFVCHDSIDITITITYYMNGAYVFYTMHLVLNSIDYSVRRSCLIFGSTIANTEHLFYVRVF